MDLKKQAEDLGIKVDGRWSDERIQHEIDKHLAGNDPAPVPVATAPEAPAEKLVPVRINRDFWDRDGERQRAGQIIEVTVEEALDGVETGALSRVK